MTLIDPIRLPAVPPINRADVGFATIGTVQPFSPRAGIGYQDLLESLRVYIQNDLYNFLVASDPQGTWDGNVDKLIEAVESKLDTQAENVNAALAQGLTDFANANLTVTDPVFLALINTANSASRQAMDALYGGAGTYHVAVPTGNAATDTANFLAAIATAQAANQDLTFSISPLGTVKAYALSQALTWDLTKGSFQGRGHVTLDFSYMPSNATGAALNITGPGANSAYSHHAAIHKLANFRMVGENNDTSALDGIYVNDTGAGIDQGLIESVYLYGFHDGITFGANVWSMTFTKVAVANSHRYGVNLSDGANAGECITLRDSTVFGSHNANGNAAGIYSPTTAGTDFRMYGGSLDYNDYAGVIQGGNLSFHAVHIEDKSANPMFTYSSTTGQNPTNVTFRDCVWDSAHTVFRDHLHEILPSSQDKISLDFDGDKGGVYAVLGGTKWLVDNSGQAASGQTVRFKNFSVAIGGGVTPTQAVNLGESCNLLFNGAFEDATTFQGGASDTNLGWRIPGVGTWTIGAGGRSGNALKAVMPGTAGVANATQRIRLDSSRRPLRVTGWQQITPWVSGSAGLYFTFFAEDGVTQVGSGFRVGVDLTAAQGWTGKTRVVVPPRGAAWIRVELETSSLNGTAYWDDVEVVAI